MLPIRSCSKTLGNLCFPSLPDLLYWPMRLRVMSRSMIRFTQAPISRCPHSSINFLFYKWDRMRIKMTINYHDLPLIFRRPHHPQVEHTARLAPQPRNSRSVILPLTLHHWALTSIGLTSTAQSHQTWSRPSLSARRSASPFRCMPLKLQNTLINQNSWKK